MKQIDIRPLAYPQVASPADGKSSSATPEIPWKATRIVALATFYKNKSWPRWDGKAGYVEFTKQNEAYTEKDGSTVLNFRSLVSHSGQYLE